jgi:hypothetical protein
VVYVPTPSTCRDVLRNQGRGITGTLLVVGLTFLYAMESW